MNVEEAVQKPRAGDAAASPHSGQPANHSRRAWAITAMVTILMMLNFGDKAVLGLAAEQIMDEFGLSAVQYGAVSSSFYLLFSLSAIGVGFIAIRVHTTKILMVLAVLWSVTTLPLLLAASIPTLYLSRILLGAAEGPASPLSVHAVQKWFPPFKRSMPTAVVQIGSVLGIVVAAPTLTYLIVNHGWRTAFIALAAAGMVWVVAWKFIGREGPYTSNEAAEATVVGADKPADEPHVRYRTLFLSPTFLTLAFAGFAVYCLLALAVAWLPTYLRTVLGFSSTAAGSLVVIPFVLGGIGMLVLSWTTGRWMVRGASSRVGRCLVCAVILVVAGSALAGLGFVNAPGPALLLVAIAFGLSSAIMPLLLLVFTDISPVRQRGAILSTGIAIASLGGIAAPVVMGAIIGSAPSEAAGFQWGFLIFAALLVASGLLAALFCQPERDARRFGITTKA